MIFRGPFQLLTVILWFCNRTCLHRGVFHVCGSVLLDLFQVVWTHIWGFALTTRLLCFSLPLVQALFTFPFLFSAEVFWKDTLSRGTWRGTDRISWSTLRLTTYFSSLQCKPYNVTPALNSLLLRTVWRSGTARKVKPCARQPCIPWRMVKIITFFICIFNISQCFYSEDFGCGE